MEKINGLDVDYLKNVVALVKENPELGKTLWRASAKWKGGFKEEVKIIESTTRMDEPADLGGTNAAVRGIHIDKVEVEVEGDIDLPGFLGLEPPEKVSPGFTNIRARVFLKTKKPVSREVLEKLHEDVVKTSPVGNTLKNPVNLEVKLETRRTV